MTQPSPVMLCILDGWGHSTNQQHNAIAQANTPNWDALLKHYPNGLLNASEHHVGLPSGQMGNSEVGHMNIGAGRIVMQDLPRIDAALNDASVQQKTAYKQFVQALKAAGGACHLMGLLSDGGVHAHQRHMVALAKLLAGEGISVHLHAFLDGRDTPPRSAQTYLTELENAIADVENIRLATLCGRYYAMDRDKRWERVERAHKLLAHADAPRFASAADAIHHAYHEADTSDEFIAPCCIGDYAGMQTGDGLLMANFRADRAREILHSLIDPAFNGFNTAQSPQFSAICGMVEYSDDLNKLMPALFPAETIANGIGELVANAGKKQLRIAETEKYAHVTFFMNGGREQPFDGEERILVPSPKVATYDLQPQMHAQQVTDKLLEAIASHQFELIIVNFANPDMVGHAGSFSAALTAVETIDTCLGQLLPAMRQAGGAMLITADHGNIESMQDASTGQAHTAHTLNPVPMVLVHPDYAGKPAALESGRLADIAPTLLAWLGLAQPTEMTGRSLLPSVEALHAA